MADDLMVERVEKLEKTLEGLVGLPDRMTAVEERVGSLELQIVQLRTEMRDEFSAVRKEAAATRSDLLEVFNAASRAKEELFKETWSLMRLLHEEVISRIARIGEARPT